MRKRVIELEHGQVVRDQAQGGLRLLPLTRSVDRCADEPTDGREKRPIPCALHPAPRLGQGLRRNLSMHLAVVLTLFVSPDPGRPRRAAAPAGPQGHRLLERRAPDHLLAVQGPRQQPRLRGTVTDAQSRPIVKVVEAQPRGRRLPLRDARKRPTRSSRRSSRDELEFAPNLGHHRRGHARVAVDRAEEPQTVRGHRQRGHGARRRRRAIATRRRLAGESTAPWTGPGGGLIIAIFLVVAAICCWWPTRSGWRRSPDGGRSASCGWSAPRRSTSRCRSCSRRWSRGCSGGWSRPALLVAVKSLGLDTLQQYFPYNVTLNATDLVESSPSLW